jgi:hypothetical protein
MVTNISAKLIASIFRVEDGGNKFCYNVGYHIQDYTQHHNPEDHKVEQMYYEFTSQGICVM